MYAESRKNKNLALFDFDGTLCTKDSFTGFIFFALRKRHIVKQGIKILPWIQAYFLNIYPADSMRPRLFKAMFSNISSRELLALALEYSHLLRNSLDQKIYKQLLKHKHNNDDVVIVSASVDLYLKDIAELLGVDLICTEAEIKESKFTGFFATPDCSNEQKKIRVLEKYNLEDYQAVYAYGNSTEDLAMLNLADFKFMVGEDQTLPTLKINTKKNSVEIDFEK